MMLSPKKAAARFVRLAREKPIRVLNHRIQKDLDITTSQAKCSCGFHAASCGKNHQRYVRDAVQEHIVEILKARDEEAKPTPREKKLEKLLRSAQRWINVTLERDDSPSGRRLSQRISRAIVR